jgi:hypothetical protein
LLAGDPATAQSSEAGFFVYHAIVAARRIIVILTISGAG